MTLDHHVRWFQGVKSDGFLALVSTFCLGLPLKREGLLDSGICLEGCGEVALAGAEVTCEALGFVALRLLTVLFRSGVATFASLVVLGGVGAIFVSATFVSGGVVGGASCNGGAGGLDLTDGVGAGCGLGVGVTCLGGVLGVTSVVAAVTGAV